MGNTINTTTAAYRPPQRIDPSTAATNILAKIDTKNQGYIDKEELQAAVTKAASGKANGATVDTAKVDALFKKLDANGDGQINKDELTDGFKKLAAEFDNNNSQVNAGRAKLEKGGAHPGGPPPGGGGGAEKANSSTTSSADTVYDPADTNKDGTVSAAELLAYQISNADKTSTSTSDTSSKDDVTTTKTANANSTDNGLKLLAQLARAYGAGEQNTGQASNAISVSA